VVVVCFWALSKKYPGKTEENHEEPNLWKPAFVTEIIIRVSSRLDARIVVCLKFLKYIVERNYFRFKYKIYTGWN
jgi:hypothetical protein